MKNNNSKQIVSSSLAIVMAVAVLLVIAPSPAEAGNTHTCFHNGKRCNKKIVKPVQKKAVLPGRSASHSVYAATTRSMGLPVVSLASDQVAGEGGSIMITATLNELAANYPVVVPLTINPMSTAQEFADFTLSAHEIVITAGKTGSISLNVISDSILENDETLILDMGTPSNANKGSQVVQNVRITESNVSPIVQLGAEQESVTVRTVTTTGGLVRINAVVSDANVNDAHSYDWSMSDNTLVRVPSASAADFVFDPYYLQPGNYTLRVKVVDNGIPQLENTAELVIEVKQPDSNIEVIASTAGDEQSSEKKGHGDHDLDGIKNRDDDEDLNDNEIQGHAEKDKKHDKNVLRTNPGLKIALGEIAFKSGKDGAQVSEKDIQDKNKGRHHESDKGHVNHGGYYDFEVSRIPVEGSSVDVVIPLETAIPARGVYRKFSPDFGWQEFTSNHNNIVKSARGEAGVCPPAGDAAYVNGLVAGSYCVQLTIQDGGPNDADNSANHGVKSIGGVSAIAALVAKKEVVKAGTAKKRVVRKRVARSRNKNSRRHVNHNRNVNRNKNRNRR